MQVIKVRPNLLLTSADLKISLVALSYGQRVPSNQVVRNVNGVNRDIMYLAKVFFILLSSLLYSILTF